MSILRYTNKHLLLTALVGAVVSYGALWFSLNDSMQHGTVTAHDQKTQILEQEQKGQPVARRASSASSFTVASLSCTSGVIASAAPA